MKKLLLTCILSSMACSGGGGLADAIDNPEASDVKSDRPLSTAPPKVIPPPPDVAGPPNNAKRTPSGVAYLPIRRSSGTHLPELTDRVKVHFSSWTTDGEMVESTRVGGRPTSLKVSNALPAWREILPLMADGDAFRIWAPSAYEGVKGKPSGMVVFDLSLLTVTRLLPPPKDVTGPPKDAITTDSGLAYRQLRPGRGNAYPGPRSRVEVHYTGWTTDGEMFDSSVTRDRTASFSLQRVVAGWTEGLQLMNTGAIFRFWIPEELAYKGARGKPKGMLVFDVELIEVD